MTLKNFTFAQIFKMLIVPAFFATLKMLAIAGVMSTILGFFFGVILVVTEKGGLYENIVINRILDFIVNMIRSFPFIILMISIIPFTRLIAGTSIGETAALVPRRTAAQQFKDLPFVPLPASLGSAFDVEPNQHPVDRMLATSVVVCRRVAAGLE